MNSMVSDNSGVGKSRDGEYKTKRNARVSTVIYIGGERFEGNARRALRRRRKINVRLLDGLSDAHTRNGRRRCARTSVCLLKSTGSAKFLKSSTTSSIVNRTRYYWYVSHRKVSDNVHVIYFTSSNHIWTKLNILTFIYWRKRCR